MTTVAHVPTTPTQEREISRWPIFLATASTLFVVLLTYGLYPGILGFLIVFGCGIGWARENMANHRRRVAQVPLTKDEAEYQAFLRQREDHSKLWWGVVLLIVTEALFFLAALLTIVGHPILHDPSAPAPFRDLNKPDAFVASLVLWASGGTAYLGQRALRKGKKRRFHFFLVFTMILGIAFLGYQASEYLRLFSEGFTLGSGAAGSIFFTVTGLHGFHVLIGIVALALLLSHSRRGGIQTARRAPAHATLLYWHFVDAVWVFIYGVLYLKAV
jgi:heme/copper-type cytochrome/quinol oxidase subunit 3